MRLSKRILSYHINHVDQMPFHLFTKTNAACSFCEKAKALLEEHGYQYIETSFDTLSEMKTHVSAFVDEQHVNSFPLLVTPEKKVVYGFEQLRDLLEEHVLRDSRLSAFPIQHDDIYDLYKQHVASFWVSDEIQADDSMEFEQLNPGEQRFVKNVLAFFSQADGLVNENLMTYFMNEVQLQESTLFYSIQSFMESEHNVTYSKLLDNLVKDQDEKKACFNAITEIDSVRQKAQFINKHMNFSERFAHRLIAFACVENLLFAGSFSCLFWLKQRHPNILAGLYQSNAFISRDEYLHYLHAVALYRKLKYKPVVSVVHSIISEAVDNEIEFICDSLPSSLVGINGENMAQYIKFLADKMCGDFDVPPIYGVNANPLPFMETLGMNSKCNFFEVRPTEYRKATPDTCDVDGGDDEDF